MKPIHLALAFAALTVGLLSGCGGSDDHSTSATAPSPPSYVPETLDTQQVLALAQKTSETASPFPVNGGLVTFSDTSDTSAAISVE